MNKYFNDSSKLIKVLICLVPLLAIYCLPIVLSDRPYIDDLGRTLYGYTGWGLNGRPLSDILMRALNFGEPLIDISPLNQLLAIFLLVSVLITYMRHNFPGASFLCISASIFFFIASPFFIENLSYKYDSLTMALSMVTLIIPFCFRNEGFLKPLASAVLVIFSLCFYQASLGLFAMLSVIEIVTKEDKHNNIDIVKSVLSRIVQVITGFLFYQLVIAPRFVEGEYNITHSKSLPISVDSFEKIKSNFDGISWYFTKYIESIPTFAVVIYSAIFITSIFIILKELANKGLKRNAASFAIVALSPFLILLFSFAPMLMLEHPVFAPRVMICFGGVMMFCAIIVLKFIKPIYLQAIICLPMLWVSLVYSYSFSASTSSQNRMDNLISTSISMDVNHHGKVFKYVNVRGKMPESSQFILSQSKLPIMSRLIPVYLNGDWLWGAELLNHFGMKLEYKVINEGRDSAICKANAFSKTNSYSLYDMGDTLIISFSNPDC